MILENIKKENDIKKVPLEDMEQLAQEIREFLLEHVSKTGGHLASNLGVVELTMALHYVFCLPEDKLIWDVGHQSYTHKILTGRKEGFEGLRTLGGMSGFPKRCESSCDALIQDIAPNFYISRCRICAGKRLKTGKLPCGIYYRGWCSYRRNGL